MAKGANERPLVDPAFVPEDDDGPAQVTQELPEKLAHLSLADVRLEHTVVEPEPMPARTHRDAGDHREAVVSLPETQQRGVPAGRPGLADAGDQEEAGFVDEDEVGTQPRGVFFLRGATPVASTGRCALHRAGGRATRISGGSTRAYASADRHDRDDTGPQRSSR